MTKTCLKCGHTAEVSDDPAAACPKCGAIYAKVAGLPAERLAPRVPKATPPAASPAPQTPESGRRSSWVERALFWLTAAGALLGMVQLVLTHATAESAPQQAAGFAMAMAYAVVPYVLARAVQQAQR